MPSGIQHLLLTTTEDSFNPKSWSGTPWSLRRALERQVKQVSVFRPPPPKRAPLDALRRLLFGPVKYPLWITRATLKQNARAVQAEIERVRPDAVLSISSQCIALLERPGVPVYLFSDAPYWAFCETYMEWETPPLRIQAFAAEEAAAGRRLDGLCFGSAWACAEAQRLYCLGPNGAAKLHVTPLGATWVPTASREEIAARIDARVGVGGEALASAELQLLFVGRDWERKGGPLAVEVARGLRAAGKPTRLHVVGCHPALGADAAPDGFVTVHGPLYQTDPEQSARLAELFLSSHLLLVPTRAECYGIVFAEAHAFGLPPVSRSVHALPSIVDDGETGLLFDLQAPAPAYVERILKLIGSPEAYRAMAHQARLRFEQHLTWDRTAEAILHALGGQ